MLEHSLDTAHSILYLRPKSALEKADFMQLAKTVDPHIDEAGVALCGGHHQTLRRGRHRGCATLGPERLGLIRRTKSAARCL